MTVGVGGGGQLLENFSEKIEKLDDAVEATGESGLEAITSPIELGVKLLQSGAGLKETFNDLGEVPGSETLKEEVAQASNEFRKKAEIYIEGEGWVGAFEEFDPETRKNWESFKSFEDHGFYKPPSFTEEEIENLYKKGGYGFGKSSFAETLRNNPNFEELEKILNSRDESGEGTGARDTWKLLLRIGVRVGFRMARYIAEEIKKNTPKEEQGQKVVLGVFTSVLKDSEGFVDKFIEGDSDADLARDVIEALRG